MVKNLLAMQETPVWSLGLEDPLEKGMTTHSSILAWRIHRQRSLASYSLWCHKESDMTKSLTLLQDSEIQNQHYLWFYGTLIQGTIYFPVRNLVY